MRSLTRRREMRRVMCDANIFRVLLYLQLDGSTVQRLSLWPLPACDASVHLCPKPPHATEHCTVTPQHHRACILCCSHYLITLPTQRRPICFGHGRRARYASGPICTVSLPASACTESAIRAFVDWPQHHLVPADRLPHLPAPPRLWRLNWPNWPSSAPVHTARTLQNSIRAASTQPL